ncbi:MAG: pyridoxamine 5'-phosphate oxidase [Gammaproteobacteria bacterium]|nr:MAG: pyridoxamine 5'-phosphate oxidase [Gammaproteobacteria bacterium]
MDISEIRKEYTRTGLCRKDLNDNPFTQFETWYQQAQTSNHPYANAMSLATTGDDQMPSVRTVLLKLFDEKGFVFFTNYSSDKAQQMTENPQAALLFPWLELERQVRISGAVEKISTAESLKYFTSRPRGSQIGAWCSDQSKSISSRSLLESQWNKMKQRFSDGNIPLPDFWGGYRVIPERIEFWQGRENRLHDRFEYRLAAQDWEIQRLAP